jgi:hypothetical protein
MLARCARLSSRGLVVGRLPLSERWDVWSGVCTNGFVLLTRLPPTSVSRLTTLRPRSSRDTSARDRVGASAHPGSVARPLLSRWALIEELPRLLLAWYEAGEWLRLPVGAGPAGDSRPRTELGLDGRLRS